MLSDFVGLGVLAVIIGFFIYTQVPPRWQGLSGFLLIVLGWLPVAVLVVCIIKAPVVLFPVLVTFMLLIVAQKRA